MKKDPKSYVFYLGFALFAVGLILAFLFPDADDIMQALPFVLVGCGSGIISVGIVNIMRKKKIDKDPKKAWEYEIAEKDERNIRIREKAGYAAWYTTLYVLAMLALVFVVLKNYLAFGLVGGAFFIHMISLFVYVKIYNKKL